jgi:hypothetical protein
MAQITNPLADLYHTNGVTFAQATQKIQQYITWIPLKLFVDPFVIFGKDSLYELNINKNHISTIVGRKNPNGKEIISILKHLMSLATDKLVTSKIYVYVPSTDIIEMFQPTRGTTTGIYGEILTRVYYEYEFTFKCDENFNFSMSGIQSVKMDTIESFSIQKPQPLLCGQPVPSMFITHPPQTQTPTPSIFAGTQPDSVFGNQPPPPAPFGPHSTFGVNQPPPPATFGPHPPTHSTFGVNQPPPPVKSTFGVSQPPPSTTFGPQSIFGANQPKPSIFAPSGTFGSQLKDHQTYSMFGSQNKDQPKSLFGAK